MLAVVGVVIIVVNYSRDYDCIEQLMCHADGGLTATFPDRLKAALGFGSEQPTGEGPGLPGPWGTVALVAGLLAFLGWLAVGRRQQPR